MDIQARHSVVSLPGELRALHAELEVNFAAAQAALRTDSADDLATALAAIQQVAVQATAIAALLAACTTQGSHP